MKPLDCPDVYRDGRRYDLTHQDIVDDIPFLENLVDRFGQPVLELACGTGRITIPLAEKGIDITGLDVVEPMLRLAKLKARQKRLDIPWINADCRTFIIHRSFKLIIFPYNSLAHLHDRESIDACFARVRDHLDNGGRFVIDYFNPNVQALGRNPAKRYPLAEYDDPDGNGRVIVTETNVYDSAKQINRVRQYYQVGPIIDAHIDYLNLRVFWPQELEALLHYNGFTVEEKHGDYDGRAFSANAPKQLLVCRKQ